jgi:hypothetical protein
VPLAGLIENLPAAEMLSHRGTYWTCSFY